MRPRTIGLVWSTLSALLWSTTFVAGRHLLAEGQASVDPVTLSLLRFALGGAVLVAIALARDRAGFLGITARQLGRLALLGLCGIVGMSVLLFYGQQTTTASNSVILMQLNPFMIALLGLAIGERVTVRMLGGLAVALVGILLVVGVLTPRGLQWSGAHLRGDVCVLVSALCWALYAVLGKRTVAELGGFRATTWAMALGALELLVLWALLPGARQWPQGGGPWLAIGYLALFPTALAFVAWYEGMRYLPLALLNVMQYLTPPATLLLAWWLLGERVAPLGWVGIALVLAGVVLVSSGDGAERPSPKEQTSCAAG
jgi:drug/metabolite transporter (DMT)-like permease